VVVCALAVSARAMNAVKHIMDLMFVRSPLLG
jgi:hypothetical protein